MESSGVHRAYCFDILEGMPQQEDHFNSAFLPNTDFHAQLQSLTPNMSTRRNNHSHLNPNCENMYHNDDHAPDERRARRMVSNRESARRSRMRKKKQTEELQQQVEQLMMLNHHLSEKVINLLESNHQILQENSQLKERVSSFHLLMADMLIQPKRNIDDVINDRNMNHLRGETSNRTNTPFGK
ncbi:unnamed protein product [Cochlearia groenlandica]